jgi:16S rRNA (guanine527-N7)-methyltransferase
MKKPSTFVPIFPESLRVAGEAFLQLLDKWNRTHSLTSLAPEMRFEELLLDSSAILPHLESVAAGGLVADFGSGMGIPAAVIAAHRPDLEVLAIDRSHKKSAFVRQVALELNLGNLRSVCSPIESLAPLNASLGTAKAVGKLGTMLGWWEIHSAKGAPFYAFIGPKWNCSEIAGKWGFEAFPYRLINMGERAILKMKDKNDS